MLLFLIFQFYKLAKRDRISHQYITRLTFDSFEMEVEKGYKDREQ